MKRMRKRSKNYPQTNLKRMNLKKIMMMMRFKSLKADPKNVKEPHQTSPGIIRLLRRLESFIRS